MFKYTPNTLKKLEEICKESEYVVRYERGNFEAGYCILQNKKVIVINRFYDLHAKINCLIDIIPQLDIDPVLLTEKSQDMYREIIKGQNA